MSSGVNWKIDTLEDFFSLTLEKSTDAIFQKYVLNWKSSAVTKVSYFEIINKLN